MTNTALDRQAPPPLPATLGDWDAMRKMKTKATINDWVEQIHRRLLEDQERSANYQRLLAAIYDEQAVERKMDLDDAMAAQMIRQKATEDPNYSELARESLAAIIKALHVTLRRYGQTRQERANTVGGVRVPNENPPPREDRSYDAAE